MLVVQNLFRRKRAREMLFQAIKSAHARYETEQGDSYYMNKLTRQVTWSKPMLLSKLNRQLSLAGGIDGSSNDKETKSADRLRPESYEWSEEEAALVVQKLFRKKRAQELLLKQ